MDVVNVSKAIQTSLINWRRDLHQIPEIDYNLPMTSQYIKCRLDEMNISYNIIAKSGIIAVIEGNRAGPTIAIRADMDALPMKEETGLSYASKNNFMHACGHDAHMAILLGVAKVISENKKALKGNVKLLFQPAEETTGGAKVMIEEGCLDNPKVDMVMCLHVCHMVDAGKIGVSYGPTTAASDSFRVKVIGKGGHGAYPHLCIDPVTTASEIISNIQKISSREIAPTHPVVLTVGKIEGGTAPNIIPQFVEFIGIVRCAYPEDRKFIEKRFKQICSNIASSNGAQVEIEYSHGYPACINDMDCTELLSKSASKIVGEENVIQMEELDMGVDDIAYYLEKTPGTYFYLGTRNPEKEAIYSEHHPKYNIDEDALWIGTAVYAQAILDYFNKH